MTDVESKSCLSNAIVDMFKKLLSKKRYLNENTRQKQLNEVKWLAFGT